jgi:hypothetical protein
VKGVVDGVVGGMVEGAGAGAGAWSMTGCMIYGRNGTLVILAIPAIPCGKIWVLRVEAMDGGNLIGKGSSSWFSPSCVQVKPGPIWSEVKLRSWFGIFIVCDNARYGLSLRCWQGISLWLTIGVWAIWWYRTSSEPPSAPFLGTPVAWGYKFQMGRGIEECYARDYVSSGNQIMGMILKKTAPVGGVVPFTVRIL